MSIPIAYPDINGHRYSWASVEIALANGKVVRGVKSINYSHKLDPGKLRGTGPEVIGRTRGTYDPAGDMEMYQLEWESMKLDLGVGFGERSFTIIVGYAEPTTSPLVITDQLYGVRITEVAKGGTEGNDPNTVKLTLDIMQVVEGGLPMFTPQATG